VYADNEKELNDRIEQMDGLFGSRLVVAKRVYYQAEQGFNSTLPLGLDELSIYFNMNSSPCASSFPFISSDLTSDDGIMYGVNRHNGSLIVFDRFSLQNANAVVFATSGAGKTYAVKLEVLRSLMMGTDVIIIDPENEYKHLSDAVGGSFMNISLSSAVKINPFDLPKPVGGADRPADIIRSGVITLKGLLRIMLGEVSAAEDSILDRALIETYAKKDITPEADLHNVEPPIMQDFISILEGFEGTEDMVIKLKKFTEGTFSGLLNSPTNVDVNNQLMVFSVRDLEDELRPIAIYMIVNYIWNTVRSELKKRILVIDEAWWLMQNEDSAKFIYALVKRCRKYYLGVTTITQDVNDFLASQYGQAIVTNSALQVLLKQSSAAIDNIQKVFMLTEGEKYLLLEGSVGQGIFFAGQKHVAMQVVASPVEDKIITSDPKQLLEIENSKQEFKQQMAQ
jgi:type IV secretory pathway VirB4 component